MTIRSFAFLLAMVAASIAAPALAQGPRPFDQNPAFAGPLPKFYFGVAGGAIFADQFNTSLDVKIGKEELKATADVTFDTGQSVGALVGYAVSHHIAVEAEIGHARFDMDRLKFGLSSPGHGNVHGGSLSGSVGLDGNIDAWTGFANLLVAPTGVGILTPYFGGGIGAAYFDSDVKSIRAFGGSIPIGELKSETDLALKGILGINLALAPRFGVGARYSYIWVDSSQSKSASSAFLGFPVHTKGKVDDFTAQTLFISGNVAF